MGLHKRKNSPYWQASTIIEHPDGKKERKFISLGTRNKRVAEIKYAELLQSIEDGSYFDMTKRVPTVGELIGRYLAEAVVTHKPKTQIREKSIAKYLIIEFGAKPVSELTTSDLSKYKSKRFTGELKFGIGKRQRVAGQSGVKRELSFLRAVWNKAINDWDTDYDGYFSKNLQNPAQKAIKGLTDDERVRYLTPDEAKSLGENLPLWLVPIIVAAVDTGLRQANIVNLKVSQVDLANRRLNIPGEVTKNGIPLPKKMTDRLYDILEKTLKNRRSKSPYVFIQSDGRSYTCAQVGIAFRRACTKAGIEDLHFHDLRHDFATFLINNGASLYQVQLALGQKDLRMAQRYAHLLPENINVTDKIGDKGNGAIISSVLSKVLTVENESKKDQDNGTASS